MNLIFNPITGNFETAVNIAASIGLLKDVPCNLDVIIGSVVRIDNEGIVHNAIADSLENSNVLGIVENKNSNTSCDIRMFGITKNIFSNLDVTKQYYLSSTNPGHITEQAPTIENSIRIIIGIPIDSNKMMVFKGERQVVHVNYIENARLDLGDFSNDLSVDTGDRSNSASILDQGLRIINGNI